MCVAVGSGFVAEHWNGSSWTLMRLAPPPGGGSGARLGAVACSDTRHCTAVGSEACGGPLAERWNGVRWTVQNIPTRPSASCKVGLAGVSCPSAKYCLAVGGDRTYLWSGKRWRSMPPPRAPGAELAAVSCAGRNRCAAVGFWVDGDLLSWWNGRRWKITRPQININALLYNTIAVSCSPDRSCMAVTAQQGDAVNIAGAYQWNGRSWMDRSPASGRNYAGLVGISCTSKNHCVSSVYVLGSPPGLFGPHAIAWNGRAWPLDRTSLATGLTSISCVTASACMMSGGPIYPSTVPVSLRNY
jgi:hypothetical protein